MKMYLVSRRVIAYETAAFLSIISLIWIDEIFDAPHLLFGADATPINWRESLFESLIILFLGAAILFITKRLFLRIAHLEGILPICASCKKIRDEKGSWHQIEVYISERSEAEFSHGICPECAKVLYPQYPSMDSKPDTSSEEQSSPVDRNFLRK